MATAADIHFWVRQHTEHFSFMIDGIVEPRPHNEAKKIHLAWSRLGLSKMTDPRAILPVVDVTHDFETRLYDATTRGAWLGWLSPDFYHHIREEAAYFKRLLTTPPSARAEFDIWVDLVADHAVALGSLVDPTKRNAIAEGFALADVTRPIARQPFALPALRAAFNASEEVDRFLRKTASLPSVIPPALRAHALREDAWFRRVLKERIAPAVVR